MAALLCDSFRYQTHGISVSHRRRKSTSCLLVPTSCWVIHGRNGQSLLSITTAHGEPWGCHASDTSSQAFIQATTEYNWIQEAKVPEEYIGLASACGETLRQCRYCPWTATSASSASDIFLMLSAHRFVPTRQSRAFRCADYAKSISV